ncbi:MAG: hypothetical protein JWQ25_1525 [Daejeonella sp.]|nr:hypothetical protein [Daejeonella sp.]
MENDLIDQNSPIKAAGANNPFSTPTQYFESLTHQTLDSLKFSQLVESDKPGFITPNGYFDELSKSIESRIRLEDIKSEFSGTGMMVGSGYFESSKDRIIHKINRLDTNWGNVVKINRNQWAKYAAAASLVVAISTAIYFNQKNSSINSQLAKVPETEIIDYLQTNSETADITSIIENLDDTNLSSIDQGISDEDLNQYIETSYN